MYIDGKYCARGPASDAVSPARYGYNGWNETIHPDRLTFELDRSSWGMDRPEKNDRPSLCWGLGTMTAGEYLAWYKETANRY